MKNKKVKHARILYTILLFLSVCAFFLSVFDAYLLQACCKLVDQSTLILKTRYLLQGRPTVRARRLDALLVHSFTQKCRQNA